MDHPCARDDQRAGLPPRTVDFLSSIFGRRLYSKRREQEPVTNFQNKHLSYSRLTRYEECPLSFKLKYIDKLPSEAGMPARFGKTVHAVLEKLLREHVQAEVVGPLSEERALELLELQWTADEMGGAQEYLDGTDILRTFVRDEGVVDPGDVLGIEQPFEIQVGRFNVLGYIDRAERIEGDGVLVRDYKTFRALPDQQEVDASLQLSLYAVAAKQLWPWAKHVKLELHMLRQGIRMRTERSEEELEAALAYASSLGEQTESATTTFAPRLNSNCTYCDFRGQCPEFERARLGKRLFVCEDELEIENVAREREEVAVLAKILYARRDELDRILKAQLESKGELVLAGMKYRLGQVARRDFPVAKTLQLLAVASGKSEAELLEKIAGIENGHLDALVKSLGPKVGKPKLNMLKAELEAVVEKNFSTRLFATRAA
jgi:RecB family exonuclease